VRETPTRGRHGYDGVGVWRGKLRVKSFYCLYESVRQVTFLIRIFLFDSLMADGETAISCRDSIETHDWDFETHRNQTGKRVRDKRYLI
jgi:hypothetical protein